VDGGDVRVVPADAVQTMANIAALATGLCNQGIMPVFVGGNHAITIGAAAGAAAAVKGRMGYLSIDTHLDTAPG
jgi:arginase family enzyme